MMALARARSRSFNNTLPEVVFVPGGDNREAQRIVRLAKRDRLRQLYRGVYSSNLRANDADVVARNWSAIVSYLAPGAVLSFRSAFDAKPRDGAVYITRTAGAREFELPGLVVRALVRENRGPILDAEHQGARDTAYSGIYIASTARAYLENLTRDQRLASRQLPQSELEAMLERTLSIRGPQALNALRDAAREAAGRLAMEAEFARLDKLIGAMLGTRPTNALTSARARARAEGRPYDAERVELFETLAAQLRNFPFADVPEPARSGRPRDLFAFVESYFSNYIEGTTFTIEEAEQIVFEGKIIPKRDEDSHDVLGTFEAAQRDPFYSVAPRGENEFIDWLRKAHRLVMGGRPAVAPGEWKVRANQAGNTLFVLPELVEATLRKGWPLFGTLEQPMAKALFAMFVVSEVHPFADGNGRISRLIT